MECLLGYAPISVAFHCSSRFKVHRNRLQTGWVDIFVPAMARNMTWQAEYSMVSPHPTTCLSRHTTVNETTIRIGENPPGSNFDFSSVKQI